MSARDRTSAHGRRQGASPARAGGATRASARRTGAAQVPTPPVDRLVVGPVPVAARGVGLLLVLAGIAGAAGLVPTYLVVGGTQIDLSASAGSVLVGMVVPLAHALVGAVLLSGAFPKFGLAYAEMAAVLALGPLLIEIYRGSTSTDRPGVEVIAGNRVLTSAVEIGPGWVLGVVALGLTMLAGIVAALTWGRTLMEDGGALDPARSSLAGGAVLLGVVTVLCLALPAADVPARVVTDPATFMQTVVIQEGPQALLERPGLALLGGLLLVGAVVLTSVIAPSLRPRLAAVGGLLAVAVTVLAAGLAGLRDAASPDLEWTAPGIGLLLAGIGYVVLTGLAWRLRRG